MSLPPLHALFRKRTLIDGAPGKAATDATGVTESITVNACTFTRIIGECDTNFIFGLTF